MGQGRLELSAMPEAASRKAARVVLSGVEQQLAYILAAGRALANRQAGVANRKFSSLDAEFAELNGAGGELAAARVMNAYPDLNTTIRSGGADFTGRGGAGIDAKTSDSLKGELLVSKAAIDRGSKSDVYVLVCGRFPEYWVVGWCSHEELVRAGNLVDYGYGASYRVKAEGLHGLHGLGWATSIGVVCWVLPERKQ